MLLEARLSSLSYFSALNMIEPIQRNLVPPLIGLLRASPRSSRSPSTLSFLKFKDRNLKWSPTRFYASPSTSAPKPPPPADLRTLYAESQNPTQQPSQQYTNYFTPPEQPPPPTPPPKLSLRPYITAIPFFLVGAASGQYVRFVIAPPPLPATGTLEDASLTASI